MSDAIARQFAASSRMGVMALYGNYGETAGRRVAEYLIWDTGRVLAEVHGRSVAVQALYRVADSLVGDVPLVEAPKFVALLEAPEPEAETETETAEEEEAFTEFMDEFVNGLAAEMAAADDRSVAEIARDWVYDCLRPTPGLWWLIWGALVFGIGVMAGLANGGAQ